MVLVHVYLEIVVHKNMLVYVRLICCYYTELVYHFSTFISTYLKMRIHSFSEKESTATQLKFGTK